MSEKWEPIPDRTKYGGIQRAGGHESNSGGVEESREPGDLNDRQRADLVAALAGLAGANVPKKK